MEFFCIFLNFFEFFGIFLEFFGIFIYLFLLLNFSFLFWFIFLLDSEYDLREIMELELKIGIRNPEKASRETLVRDLSKGFFPFFFCSFFIFIFHYFPYFI